MEARARAARAHAALSGLLNGATCAQLVEALVGGGGAQGVGAPGGGLCCPCTLRTRSREEHNLGRGLRVPFHNLA